jgi:anion-transporting  ArsA/GET3 family ATPase
VSTQGISPLSQALETRRILLCVGSGGVGKTTTAAALAVEAARRGRRTAVLTVDPSHRLKDTLGLATLSARPRRVNLAAVGARGAHLDAFLLDVKRTFDDLVHALAPTPEHARAVLENRLYQNLSGTLAGTAEYMAVEQVYRLAEEGGYDLLVVDTPPARHAVDFLDAPRRLANLLDSRVFAILKDPTTILPAAGSRLAHTILAAVLRGLERFTGLGLVREVGDFVRVIEDLTGALRVRVGAVSALLQSAHTAPILVTAPEPRLVSETETLARALAGIGLAIEGIVVNRALPRALFGPAAPDPGLPDGVSPPLGARLARSWDDLRALAARQAATLAPLVASAAAPIVAEVPLLPADPGSLTDLAAIARHLFPETAGAAVPPATELGA